MTDKPLVVTCQRKWVTLLLMAVVFAAGGAIGAGIMAIIRPPPRPAWTPPASSQQIRDRLVDRINERVKLTPAQSEQVRRIADDYVQDSLALRASVQPQMSQEMNELHDDVAAVLTENQKPAWDTLFAEFKARWTPVLTSSQPASGRAAGTQAGPK
jgi:ElaB/YqjD/DUF883 family membrane-anchored ribosome-binding protein